MDMGDFNKGFRRSSRNFIVLTEASGVIEPSKRAFNDPPPREFFPFVGLDFSDISTPRPNCSSTSDIKVPLYPASAQNFRMEGYRAYACFAAEIPAFVSWILAA